MKPHEKWLVKARHDLKSAKKLIEGDDKILDTAIYHCQQCAEKAFKAYLAYQNTEIQKTHDVELLVELCTEFDPQFEKFFEDAITLTPYATLFRYPDILLEPEVSEVESAIEKSENILRFVEKEVKKNVAKSNNNNKNN
jgi:HEPN domain-containing protein